MDLNNKIIFCDWHDVLSHYNLPKIYLSKISNMCKENNHKFVLSHDLDDVYLDSHIVAYIGNRPHNKLLNLETLKWIHFGSVGVDKIDLKKASQKISSLQMQEAFLINLFLIWLFVKFLNY